MKNAKGNLKPVLILLLILVGFELLFLVSYAPFMHNHPLNQPEKGSCPAFIIETMLLTPSPLLLVIVFLVFPFFLFPVFPVKKIIYSTVICKASSPRGPPLSF
ncbi:hypothetical protein BMS3Abin05_01139 [bacterium BMS3Abin05]|nr:hypothetical protein BMS3Abin05_01139 [bacterium BMS3Abin05]GBE27009.1 hypothetical protein BMS3Bbin03_00929 [bacterium BMS3Bbin03]HDK35643.1 hypothetical protein [Bacteroidota bacterium]